MVQNRVGIIERELRILKAISVGIQGRVYDRVYYIVDGKQRCRAYTRPGDPKTVAQALTGPHGGPGEFIRDGVLKARCTTHRETAGAGRRREIRRFVRIVRPRGGNRIPVKRRKVVSRAPT